MKSDLTARALTYIDQDGLNVVLKSGDPEVPIFKSPYFYRYDEDTLVVLNEGSTEFVPLDLVQVHYRWSDGTSTSREYLDQYGDIPKYPYHETPIHYPYHVMVVEDEVKGPGFVLELAKVCRSREDAWDHVAYLEAQGKAATVIDRRTGVKA